MPKMRIMFASVVILGILILLVASSALENASNANMTIANSVNPDSQKAAAAPFLVIESVYTEPAPLKEKTGAILWAVIRNDGDVDFVDGRISLTISSGNEKTVTDFHSQNIAIGELLDYPIDLEKILSDKPGAYDIRLDLDYFMGNKSLGGFYYETSILVGSWEGDKSGDVESGPQLVVLVIISLFVGVAIILSLAGYRMRVKKNAKALEGNELQSLYKEREELEKRISIAKVKFYKRKLDEESYKEIVKENQGRLIEIEAKIGEMKDRISALENRGVKN
jgi:hypothetical protein